MNDTQIPALNVDRLFTDEETEVLDALINLLKEYKYAQAISRQLIRERVGLERPQFLAAVTSLRDRGIITYGPDEGTRESLALTEQYVKHYEGAYGVKLDLASRELSDRNQKTEKDQNMKNEIQVTYIEDEQDWDAGETKYWFELSGIDCDTGVEFNGSVDRFAVVESGTDIWLIDHEGNQLQESSNVYKAVSRHCIVDDEMRGIF